MSDAGLVMGGLIQTFVQIVNTLDSAVIFGQYSYLDLLIVLWWLDVTADCVMSLIEKE